LTTLDILSNGRLCVGFGLGWPVGTDRSIFAGSLDQVKRDVDDVKKLDANEIFLMIFPDGPIEDLVASR